MSVVIVINDEGVNRYGFRVLTKGIGMKAFKENPVLLYNHRRSYQDQEKALLPLGRWENIRVVDGQLVAEPVLDLEDETGAALQKKLDNGFLNAASIGFQIIEWSEDPKLMLPGQIFPTVTKCELQEVSLVDIPANPNCVRLAYNGATVICGDTDNGGEMNKLSQIFKHKKTMDKETLKQLGLPEDATEEQIRLAVVAMKTTSDNAAQLLAAEKGKQAKLLVDSAIAAGKITAAQEETYLKLALADYDSTKSALEAIPVYEPISKQLSGASSTSSPAVGGLEKPALVAKYDAMATAGTLLSFSRQNPDEFKKMQAEKVEFDRAFLMAKGVYKSA